MGEPKLILPWGRTTVLGQVVETVASAGIEDILVVTGGAHIPIEAHVALLAKTYPIRAVYNPDHATGGMVSSIQTGLVSLGPEPRAALIALGDQPQVRKETVVAICDTYYRTEAALVFLSFGNQRGHPWLASRSFWTEILNLGYSANARQLINAYTGRIEYIEADESVLKDMDTKEDYNRQRP